MLSRLFIKTALAYFVFAIALGLYMGITQDKRLLHVHTHLNLLGWVALALVGLIYRAWPALERGLLPRAHAVLHNFGLPLFMGGIAIAQLGGPKWLAPIAGGSLAVGIGALLLALHVFATLRAEGTASADGTGRDR